MGLALSLTACNLDVQNPGRILDDQLNDPELMDIVATGVSAEFTDVGDETAFLVARLTDEMVGSGSYTSTGLFRRGMARSGDDDVDDVWAQSHEVIWTANGAIERFEEVLGAEAAGTPRVVRSRLFEGLAHRILGENYCQVAYDAGPAEPKSGAFNRAVTAFDAAISNARTKEADVFKIAAYGGLAQAYVGLGDWAKAVEAARQVPTDFVYSAVYHPNEDTNLIYSETHDRPEMSAFATLAATLPTPDPRAPFTVCGEKNASGSVVSTRRCRNAQGASGDRTPHYRQEKYNDLGTEIPVVKGTEMRLIEAEAALRSNDLATFTNRINQVRAFHDIAPIATPTSVGSLENADPNDAWSILDRERYLTLWLEGRRLWDLHRWDHPFLDGGRLVDNYDVVNPRTSCLPIPEDECELNPNLSCG